MNIQDIINNLHNTIEGKTQLLILAESYASESVVIDYLRINIDELCRIKSDLQKVIDKS